MKIAISQINPIIAHFEYNYSLIVESIRRAKEEGCELAILPELVTVGYPPKDLLEKSSFTEKNLRLVDRILQHTKGINVLMGYVDFNKKPTGKPLINSVALISDGNIQKKGGKRLLPTYDVFDETRYFEPAMTSLVFELKGIKFGVTICEDIWNFIDHEGIPKYDIDPVSELVKEGIDVLINISSSPYTIGKGKLRMEILKNIFQRYKIPSIYCNQVGGNDELIFDGSSMVIDKRGELILLGKEFEEDFLIYDTDKTYEPIKDPWPEEEESILKALVLGTRDYVSKCGFKDVLVGLSGGIDSSLVAAIATMALGSDKVLGVSMPSRYTSQMSRKDAKELAENLGIRFIEIPIDEIFTCYLNALKDVFRGYQEDETEENIQARIRGNILMAISNKTGSLLLTTGNKSELAVGYCTLYGDLSGGLAAISDIPKTMCYRLAKFINREREIIPKNVLVKPPSAELKPDQKDQDTLPPYDILDKIIEASVVKNMSYEDIVNMGIAPEVVKDVMVRLVKNEYKRRQAPPGLKITTKAFGYGRRYPIARGGDPI